MTTYTITPSSEAVNEGDALTLTVERSTRAGSDTVYLSTFASEGYSNNADYEYRVNTEVTFAEGEDKKIVTIQTYRDNLIESDETFAAIIKKKVSDPANSYLDRSTFKIIDGSEIGRSLDYSDSFSLGLLPSFNEDLTTPHNPFMIDILGVPEPAGGEYRGADFASDQVKELLDTRDVLPGAHDLTVTGITPALDSLEAIFQRAGNEIAGLFDTLGTPGMLVVRYIGLDSSKSISNHSWGIAIDLQFGPDLDVVGDGLIQVGLAALIPYFNRAGWFAGAGYGGAIEDSMHFEASEELLNAWFPASGSSMTLEIGDGQSEHLKGDSLNNRILAQSGDDVIRGFGGVDFLAGGEGSDFVKAGKGDDTIYGDDPETTSLARHDSLVLEKGPETSTSSADVIYGGAGNDQIFGQDGRDTLNGGDGEDILHGGPGKDKLNGGKGNDKLFGDSGKDKFIFNIALRKTNVDKVKDFEIGKDTIRLDKSIFEEIGGRLSKHEFKIGKQSTAKNDYIIYNQSNGNLIYDANGHEKGGETLFAKLGKNLELDHDDFHMM